MSHLISRHLVPLLVLAAAPAWAQGEAAREAAVPAAACGSLPCIAPPEGPGRAAAGDTARALFAGQAAGVAAGGERSMTGPAAQAAWQRYLDSFTRPIPQWFDQTVDVGSGS